MNTCRQVSEEKHFHHFDYCMPRSLGSSYVISYHHQMGQDFVDCTYIEIPRVHCLHCINSTILNFKIIHSPTMPFCGVFFLPCDMLFYFYLLVYIKRLILQVVFTCFFIFPRIQSCDHVTQAHSIRNTVCQRSSDLFFLVSYYIK